MKNYFTLFVLALLLSCCKDDDKKEARQDLVTPAVSAFAEYSSQFVGALVVYPCDTATSQYVGNYSGDPVKLAIFPASYIIGKNNFIKSAPAILLPLGDYTLIYWGVPLSNTPSYASPSSVEPSLSFQAVMKDTEISLRQTSSSGIYYPVYDYVYGRQEIKIGSDPLTASLKRAVGGVTIEMKNTDTTPLEESIRSITILINNIAKSVNFYTGAPSTEAVSVRFPLTIAADRMSATNATVMLFPSTAAPTMTITITLTDGTVKTYSKEISSIKENNKVLIDINIGDILSSPGDGGFTVDEWTESKEEISLS